MTHRRLGVYIHVPFCLRKCSYCAFVSYPGKPDAALAASYVTGALLELGRRAYERPEGFDGWTLFIGGGTPTMLKDGELERLVSGSITQMSTLGWGAPLEATVEANPGTFSHKSAYSLVKSGITRFSIGVQSLVDSELKAIGRIHSAEDAELAFEAARCAKPRSVSVDIIVGLPGQDESSLIETLKGIAALKPEHVSCYGLSIEENTPLKTQVEEGLIQVPDDDTVADLLDISREWLEGMGLQRYEVSNFAKPGFESLHNLAYWSDMPYIGIGVAAHSYDPVKLIRSWNVKDTDGYIRLTTAGSSCEEGFEALDREKAMSDALIMALRTVAGASLSEIEGRYNVRLSDENMEALAWGKANGLLLVRDNGNVALTEKGFMLSNSLFCRLV